MDEPIFLDTNILMYAVGSNHPLKQPCLNILEKVSRDELTAVTDTEVFQEVAYRYWAQKKWKIAMQIWKDLRSLFTEIYSVDKDHLTFFYNLLNKYQFLTPRDAIHIAVMQAYEIKNVYTADKAFQKIPFLTVHNPATLN